MSDRRSHLRLRTPRRWLSLPELPAVFYTHPFELCLGLALIGIAIRGALAGQVTPSIDSTLPLVPRVAYQSVSGFAGVLMTVGLLTRDRWRPGKGFERAGLYLAVGAFYGYAIVLSATTGARGFVNVGMSIAIGSACWLRSRSIRKADMAKLDALQKVNRGEASS